MRLIAKVCKECINKMRIIFGGSNMLFNPPPSRPLNIYLKASKGKLSKKKDWLYLSYLNSYQDNKVTLFSSNVKVEENKTSLFS